MDIEEEWEGAKMRYSDIAEFNDSGRKRSCVSAPAVVFTSTCILATVSGVGFTEAIYMLVSQPGGAAISVCQGLILFSVS